MEVASKKKKKGFWLNFNVDSQKIKKTIKKVNFFFPVSKIKNFVGHSIKVMKSTTLKNEHVRTLSTFFQGFVVYLTLT